jgi:hypothetical protein
LLKQGTNTYFDEEDNIDVVQMDEVENEIENINEELNELKDSELTNEDEDNDFETLMEQEGGKLSYLDESEDENEENGFNIKLGIFVDL